jgi:pyruvate dehydrogenase (quinone)
LLARDQPRRRSSHARDRLPFLPIPPHKDVKTIQVDRDPHRLGRRAPLELAVVGDVKKTLASLLPMIEEKSDDKFLSTCLKHTERFDKTLQHY